MLRTHASTPLLLTITSWLLVCQMACLTALDLDGDYDAPDDALDMNPTVDMPDVPRDEDTPPTPDLSDMKPDALPDLPEDEDMPDQDMPKDEEDMEMDMPPSYQPGEGLFFSEIVEGTSGNNKFIELYNARDTPMPLEHIWLATFNTSADPELSSAVTFDIGAKIASIPAKGVIVLCHSGRDQLMGSSVCDFEMSTVLNFNGDDPLAIYFDQDMNDTLDASDILLDSFGQLDNSKPAMPIWADASYKRCKLTPYLGGSIFDPTTYYIVTKPETYTHLGVPPTEPTSCP